MPTHRVFTLSLLHRGLQAAGMNTVIAVGLSLALSMPLLVNLVYSQAIGMAIWALIDIGQRVLVRDWQTQWRRLLVIVPVAAVAGFAIGLAIARAAGGPLDTPPLPFERLAALLLLSLAAAVVVTYYFASREHAKRSQAQATELARAARQARLNLLEAQLEPHMLFNTLANLRALIGLDTVRAQAMLDHLVAYLRATLGASQRGTHTLETEFARLHDYLALMSVRMGPRLGFRLNLPPALADHEVPSLLLQPLVENSIRHGIEPLPAGGHVEVSAAQAGDALVLEVNDTGAGPKSLVGAGGFGLAQVRERLQLTHGPAARLELLARCGGGTTARIRLPLDR
ncbi:histidine kinase [Ramlibacter sp. AW1]|uniref:Histidine kinase n=1 Tax=Ramlibacter aurantiacus TaxID=2801330 RepID=A0A936ZJL2_9BURK|nr:histidine kinase [Ramlibacter aurantiacus]MBL0421022.1 histidine kinase [Ramlibacter aurantiacus]